MNFLPIGLPAFLSHFGLALLLVAIFFVVYIFITPYHELRLIRAGNHAAAASLAGALLGYVAALASAIANSVSLFDMLVWGVVALVVQLLAFLIVKLLLPTLLADIPENKIASGVFLGTVSLGLGLLNAACMTY
jgi:putative membrane protein